jgi:tryptophan-rich sensory protein
VARSASTVRFGLAAAPALAAAIGALGARQAPRVYGRLRKPRWAPPQAAFAPVWTALYVLLGVAGWRLGGRRVRPAVLCLHCLQLALNALWPAVFFGRRNPSASVTVIAALDASVAGEIALLRRDDPATAWLLAPYLAWCGFATALNVKIVRLCRRGRAHKDPD